MRYRLQTGSLAWVIHRLTGVALTLYLFLHLYVLSHLRDPQQYASLMQMMRNPLVRLAEAGLLGLVISHAFNGLRLTLLDLGVETHLQRRLFWLAAAAGAGLFVMGAVPIIRGGG